MCRLGEPWRPLRSTLGPFARFRPNVRLEAGAHVGNFVELKNTTLGPGAVWTLVGAVPVQAFGMNIVTVPLSGTGKFFRLQSP